MSRRKLLVKRALTFDLNAWLTAESGGDSEGHESGRKLLSGIGLEVLCHQHAVLDEIWMVDCESTNSSMFVLLVKCLCCSLYSCCRYASKVTQILEYLPIVGIESQY